MLLVCMHLVVCLFVCKNVYIIHYCCLKSCGVFYFSNVWRDHIPDANCTGVKGEHCSLLMILVGPVVVLCGLCYFKFSKMSWLVS